jgi:acyl-CoA synthetase (AMP-forming)/AMP-acid ligase II
MLECSLAGVWSSYMRNFYQLFTESASRYPGNIAVEIQQEAGSSSAGERFTFAELRRLAEAVGNWLEQQRLEPGARCALLAANHPRWVAAYLGTLASGRVAVPLDTAFNPAQVRKLLLDSGASLIFTDQRNLENARAATPELGIPIVLLDGAVPGRSRRPGGPALHVRHHRRSQGRHAHP